MTSALKYIKETIQNEWKGIKSEDYNYKSIFSGKMIDFRKQEYSVERVDRPANLASAKSVGYKAKQGILVARVKIRKGSGLHPRPNAARRPKRMGVKKLTRNKSIQSMAEVKASKKFANCEVLGSYLAGEDGVSKFFDVVLVEPENPSIKADKNFKWLAWTPQRGKAERGLTSAGKKGRTANHKTKRKADKKKNN